MGGITAEKLTKAYIKIREERAKLSAEYKEKDSVLSRQLERVKKGLLDYCNAHGVESVRTAEGFVLQVCKAKVLDKRLGEDARLHHGTQRS